MIGKQIQKPVVDTADYTKTALWCTSNKAMIEDKGDCYEVVALPEPTLEEVKAAKLAEINSVCDSILNAAAADYPASEIQTFSQQTAEAQAYVLDKNASVPLLKTLAQARGIELDELVQRVLVKHDVFSTLSGVVIGQRQAFEDRLQICETVDEVQAIEVNYELPGADNGQTS